MRAVIQPDGRPYAYAGTGYPDPDALTQITDGHSITACAYDAKGPLTSTLEGTNVTSDSAMNVAQWFDYAPYGNVLATTNTGATAAARGYIGQFSDLSGLSYLNARYYNGAQGQFTSQDPTFLALGNPNQLQQISQQDQQLFLSDPQQINAYSYGRSNPITVKDPSGNSVVTEAAEWLIYRPLYGYGAGETTGSAYQYLFGDKSGASPQQIEEQRNDFYYELAKTGVATAGLFSDPVGSGGIDAGGIVLSIKDPYCGGHVCKDFSGGLKSIGEIVAGIPTGPIANPTIMPQAKGGSSPGGSSGNGPVTHTATPQGGGGVGSGSYQQQLVGLYQSLVSVLTAYVSALSVKH
jgi:RHS repeat-associated protein